MCCGVEEQFEVNYVLGRAFLTAYNSASDGKRLRMAEGLGKGAGLTLLAIPIVEAF